MLGSAKGGADLTDAPNEITREMRLVEEFIARRRQPNSDLWMTWDMMTIKLHEITGEVFTDVSLRRWAQRYGIPENTREFGGTHSQSEYAAALAEVGISL